MYRKRGVFLEGICWLSKMVVMCVENGFYPSLVCLLFCSYVKEGVCIKTRKDTKQITDQNK